MYAIVIPSGSIQNLQWCTNAIRIMEPKHGPFVIVTDNIDADVIPLNAVRLEGKQPFIFARNVNAGIDYALGCPEITGVIVLGDDGLLMHPLGFTKLHAFAEANPEYGVIAAGTNNCGNPVQRWESDADVRETDAVAFICVHISRECVEKIGTMDERFQGYGYDDDDYCRRARNAGFKVGVYDGCKIDHMSLPSKFRENGVDISVNREIYEAKWDI